MANLVRAANPIWFMVDLDGLPLNDEYYIFFLTNTLPYLPQTVYRDVNGLATWPTPLEFFSNGTLPENMYFDDTAVYRIEVRHGNTQADALVYEVNNWVPGDDAGSSQNNTFDSNNQIINPQFAVVDFSSPYTFTQALSGNYSIDLAPGWSLVLVGQGTTVLTQLSLPGTDDIQGNPPYALRINNSGWDQAFLQQRFENNGAIFSNGAVAMSITARATGTPQDLTLSYVPSAPGTPVELVTGTIGVGDFNILSGAANVPASTNSNIDESAFVDMVITLEATGTIDITNAQVVGQEAPLPSAFDPDIDIPLFQEQTLEQQFAGLFAHYFNGLLIQPRKSIASGWNFRGNPWQFNAGTGTTVSTTPIYVADQTIIMTSAVNSISASRSTDPLGLLQISALNGITQGQIAVFQFIEPRTTLPYYGYEISALVRARIVTSVATQIKIKFRAFTMNGPVGTMTSVYPVTGWDSNGDPIFNINFTPIIPENDPVYILQNNYDQGIEIEGPTCPPMAFNGMNLFPQISGLNVEATVGLMVYTIGPLSNDPVDSILFDQISVIPNSFAMDSIALTYDEMVRECQFYYEKSYNTNVLPGTITTAGQSAAIIAPNSQNLAGVDGRFKVTKRAMPSVTFYSPNNGAMNSVYNGGGTSTVTSITGTGMGATGFPNVSVAVPPDTTITAHWVADARIGL